MHEPVKPLTSRYEIGSAVASGSIGVVYRSRCLSDGTTVALKVARGHPLGPHGKAGFYAAACRYAGLVQPGVVPLLDYGVDPNQGPYYATEWIEGLSLSRFLDGPKPWPVVADLFVRLMGVVARCHARGVFHGDLKPTNILVGRDLQGRVAILDHGMAEPLAPSWTSGEADPEDPTALPPWTFRAPELLRRRGRRPTAESDLYALGALLHLALTGSPPFPGTAPLALMSLHVSAPVPTLNLAVGPGVNNGLNLLLSSLLAKEPLLRGTAAGAAQVLNDLSMRGDLTMAPDLISGQDNPTLEVTRPEMAAASPSWTDFDVSPDQVPDGVPTEEMAAVVPSNDTLREQETSADLPAAFPDTLRETEDVSGTYNEERLAIELGAGSLLAGSPRPDTAVDVPGILSRTDGTAGALPPYDHRQVRVKTRPALRDRGLAGQTAVVTALKETFAEVVSTGRARVVVLKGPPGSGRGTIARWLRAWCSEEGAARCLNLEYVEDSSGESRGLADLARSLAKQVWEVADREAGEAGDGSGWSLGPGAPDGRFRQTTRDLDPNDDQLPWDLPDPPTTRTLIESLLGSWLEPDSNPEAQTWTGALGVRPFAGALVCHFLRRIAPYGPPVVTLRDIQWAGWDRAVEFLELLHEEQRFRPFPVLVVATYSPSGDRAKAGRALELLQQAGAATVLEIEPLSGEELQELGPGSDYDNVDLLRALVEAGGEGTFHAAQLLLHLQEDDLLTWTEDGRLTSEQDPAVNLRIAFRSVLQRRLALVANRRRDVTGVQSTIEWCAILGDRVGSDLLGRAVLTSHTNGEIDIAEAVDAWARAGVLEYEGAGEVRFTHHLFRAAVLSSMFGRESWPRRNAIAAELRSSARATSLGEAARGQADLLTAAGDRKAARTALVQYADWVFRWGWPREALWAVKRAAGISSRSGESPTPEEALHLASTKARILAGLGRIPEARAALEDVAGPAVYSATSPLRPAWLLARSCALLAQAGQGDTSVLADALTTARDAVGAFAAAGNLPGQAAAQLAVSETIWLTGDPAGSQEAAGNAAQLAATSGSVPTEARAQVAMARCLRATGNLPRMMVELQRAREQALETRTWDAYVDALELLAEATVQDDGGPSRRDLVLELFAAGRLLGDPLVTGIAVVRLGQAESSRGNWSRAARLFGIALEAFRDYPEHVRLCAVHRARCLAEMGDWSRSLECADMALAGRLPSWLDPASVQAVERAGRLASGAGHGGQAWALLEEARGLWTVLGRSERAETARLLAEAAVAGRDGSGR